MTIHELGNPRVADAGLGGDFSPAASTNQQSGPDLIGEFCVHDRTIAKLCYSHKQHFASNALHTEPMSRPSTNEILAKNLEKLMQKRGLVQTALAKRSGVAQTTISLYRRPESRQPSKSGKIPSPKLTEVEALATALGVSLVQILSPSLQAEIAPFVVAEAANDEDHTPVRLVDAKASAGKGKIIFSEDVNRILMFRRDWLARHGITNGDDAACFEVDGRSMVDAGIPDESIVIVNLRKIEPIPKKIYLVNTERGLIVKQLVQESDRWIARSCNEAEKDTYPDLPVGPEARVLGRAFWCAFEL